MEFDDWKGRRSLQTMPTNYSFCSGSTDSLEFDSCQPGKHRGCISLRPARLRPTGASCRKTGISTLGFISPTYTSEERDYLIRTIAYEASGEPDDGKAAVAHVVLTRKRSGKWGDTIKDVVTYPWQFESWMTKRAEMESLDVEDHRYRSAAQIADAVLAGQMADPTTGATHFLNPTVVRKGVESLPSWATGGGLSIGRHTFYAPDAVAWVARITRPSLYILLVRGSAAG